MIFGPIAHSIVFILPSPKRFIRSDSEAGGGSAELSNRLSFL